MNIAIIGATGMIGQCAVAEATARGHNVVGYSHSDAAIAGAQSKTVDLTLKNCFPLSTVMI